MNNKDKIKLTSLLSTAGAAIEAAFDILEKSGECDHPIDKRKDHSTMGTKRWQCGVCGYVYEEAK